MCSAETLDILRTLIGFDTTSRNSNLELIDYVKAYLDELAIPYRLTYDDERRKANLFATLESEQSADGYILSGHTDVVPVDGQDWKTDPFELTEIDGKLYGRGTADMKSYVAVVLAALPEMKRRRLSAPIHVALSYDEEVGCVGVRRLIADMTESGHSPKGCIVGEPTSMSVVVSNKGKRSYRCRIRGLAAHSSLAPSGVNAVEYAGNLIAFIQQQAQRFAAEGPFDKDYDCAHTTVHVGVIQGGTSLNVVPQDCVFEFEFRHLPGDDPVKIFNRIQAYADQQLLPQMRTVYPQAAIKFEPLVVIPVLDTDVNAEVTALARSIRHDDHVQKFSYNCEACLFQQVNVPSIVCGPGDIKQAHKPNEYVEISQITQCEEFIKGLMDKVCITE